MPRENIRKPERALSARFVEAVIKPGKYYDRQGLFLRVAKNGSKQWVQRIAIRGKRCELGLGSPPAVTLATARKLALDNRGKAMLSGDPLAEKRAAKTKPLTFRECVERCADAKLTEIKSEKHRKGWLPPYRPALREDHHVVQGVRRSRLRNGLDQLNADAA